MLYEEARRYCMDRFDAHSSCDSSGLVEHAISFLNADEFNGLSAEKCELVGSSLIRQEEFPEQFTLVSEGKVLFVNREIGPVKDFMDGLPKELRERDLAIEYQPKVNMELCDFDLPSFIYARRTFTFHPSTKSSSLISKLKKALRNCLGR